MTRPTGLPASESREYLLEFYRTVWALSDAVIAELPLHDQGDAAAWSQYVARIQQAADEFRLSRGSAQRPMSATVAPVIRTRSVGESPRSSPRRPPDT